MSKKVFTEKEIKQLSTNKYVESISSKGITYTDDFKHFFIAEREKGKFAREIFGNAVLMKMSWGFIELSQPVRDGKMRTKRVEYMVCATQELVALDVLEKGNYL